jgi:hypothetical protein
MNHQIKQIAAVLPGISLQVRAGHEPEGTHQIILPRHLTEGQPYRYNQQLELRLVPKRAPDKYRVFPGDVLFVSRGIRNHAVVVESVAENSIASGTLYILRAKQGVDPVYLAWCINQLPVQAKIAQVRTGAGTPIVQRSDFSNITLPFPDTARQNQIAKLSQLMAREKQLRQQLVNETENYHRQVGQKLFNGIFRD